MKAIHNRDKCNVNMNKQSSHSHLIFTLTFEEIKNDHKIFKLNFVVLTGSERSQSYSTSNDDVIDSLVKTDKGLVSLLKVLTYIYNGNFCINFSDSKLTSILKDSFYSDSITLMLANVNQKESSLYETIRTLDFANLAKSISFIRNENNQNSSLELVNSLKNEIQILRKELDKHKSHNESTNIQTTFNIGREMSYIETFMNHDENYNPNTETVEHNILINKINRVDHSSENKKLTKNSTYVSLEPKILTNRSTNDGKSRKSNHRKKSVEDKIGVINDKLKIFKDFQTSIKNKIADSELSKIKVIRNKNEEVTFYKREMHEKERKLKLLELEKEKNKELLGYHESTIYALKNELRNKSIELKNIKNSTVNKKEERKSAVRVSKNQNLVKNTRMLFLEAMKEMISEMERNIIQKDKFEKRLEELVKEEEEANLNLRINEEKIKYKIEALIKKKKYTFEDSESYNKSKIIINSEEVSSLNLKLEKLNLQHSKIIKDLQGNKEIVLAKLSELNQNIDHLRNQISNGENVKINNNVEEMNDKIIKLERELQEKNEKCMSFEIQCANLDNKYKEIEKSTAEKLLFYKVKSKKLEEELKIFKEVIYC